MLHVYMVDGCTLGIPLSWYPRLEYGNSEERAVVELWNDGSVLAWPHLDEHIAVEALLAGHYSQEIASSLECWKKQLDVFRKKEVCGEWGVTKPR